MVILLGLVVFDLGEKGVMDFVDLLCVIYLLDEQVLWVWVMFDLYLVFSVIFMVIVIIVGSDREFGILNWNSDYSVY